MKLEVANETWDVSADLTQDIIVKDRRGRHCLALPSTFISDEIVEIIKIYARGRKHGREQSRDFFRDRVERIFADAVL